jgi:hypothetical protein
VDVEKMKENILVTQNGFMADGKKGWGCIKPMRVENFHNGLF